jgi:3-phenylpropionate/trans-cinnamate dioxygenase ferredoxin reductase subunit
MAELDHIARGEYTAITSLPPPLVDADSAALSEEGHEWHDDPPSSITPIRGMMPIVFMRRPTRPEPPKVLSPLRVSGRLVRSVDLARDIVEVTIAPDAPIHVLPGQHCRFSFSGLPFRQFSPTAALGTLHDDGYLRLHIKRVRGGCVTPHVGKTIKAGHPVQIAGPYGRAFSCPASAARLVLISGGTGFAPIWAIAAAQLRESPTRPIVIAGAASTLDTFYMAPALELTRRYPKVSIVASVDEIGAPWHGFVPGPLAEHLPKLTSNDIVYAAGGHALVGAVGKAAALAGASFHADPLEPAPQCQESWIESARRWLSVG